MIGSIIGWAIFGLVAGALARLLHPGRDPMNWVWTMLLGIGGAVVGGWLGRRSGHRPSDGLASWIAAIGGSSCCWSSTTSLDRPKPALRGGPATSDDYKKAVFDDLRAARTVTIVLPSAGRN